MRIREIAGAAPSAIFCKLVHAVIADNGRGMPLQATDGVGLSGMRGRLAELGGRLTVIPKQSGTMIVASVPANIH